MFFETSFFLAFSSLSTGRTWPAGRSFPIPDIGLSNSWHQKLLAVINTEKRTDNNTEREIG
jgi:hypothetical protein